MAIPPPVPPPDDDRAGVTGPGTETVPAWLSSGEFVVRIAEAGGV